MTKPMICMSAREFYFAAYHITTLSNIDSYSDYIRQAGGLPCTFFAHDEKEAQAAAEAFDGLLLSGGADLDPSLYGEENNGSFPGPERIDNSDLYLYKAFKKAGKPILAICRGIQVIAAAEGVKLIQDIPSQGIYGGHNQREADPPVPNYAFFHECDFVSGTRLHEIFGDRYPVNSFHHQAAASCPQTMKEAARGTDGILEAFESGNILAVQWHPERLAHDPKHMKIAETFIMDCSAH
jgi:putative glutamine amidotransferase